MHTSCRSNPAPGLEVFCFAPCAADDGPEVDVIKAIRATHQLYTPGKEAELLKFQRFVDKVARQMFGDRYGRLGLRRKATVRQMVINLHVDGFRPGSEFLITPQVLGL